MNGLGSLASFNTWTLALQMIPEEGSKVCGFGDILCTFWKRGRVD